MSSLQGTAQTVMWLIAIVLMGTAGFLLAGGGRLSRLLLQLNRNTRSLRCRESIRLTPQHTLHVVEWEDRRFVVACHPSGTTVLSPIATEAESQAAAAVAGAATAGPRGLPL